LRPDACRDSSTDAAEQIDVHLKCSIPVKTEFFQSIYCRGFTVNSIPDSEFSDRIQRFQKNIRSAGLDAALVHGNESDFANVRYLSDYWPIFEAGGVFVLAEGVPVLLIGPESET
jgi:Creatinase/Prolidase N-terminal domain